MNKKMTHREHTHTPKALRNTKDILLRIAKQPRVEASEVKDPITVLADLFKGVRYTGPPVRVTHKQAFDARALKRTAKALAAIAMETLTAKIDAAEGER